MAGCDPDDGAGGDLAGTWELVDFRLTQVSTTDSFPITADSRLRDDDVVLELNDDGTYRQTGAAELRSVLEYDGELLEVQPCGSDWTRSGRHEFADGEISGLAFIQDVNYPG